MLEPGIREDIHYLWDELTDFDISQTDAATWHLQTRLCHMVGAWNGTWGGAMRLDADNHDPLQGWRVAITQLLYPILLPMRHVGHFRTYTLRRDLPADWFEDAFYRAYFQPYGTIDAAFVGFPINRDTESHFGFYSRTAFTERDLALLAYALRGIKWFHRQVMLTSGPLIAKSPLTPTERKVLRLLLTQASEKTIATQLDQAASTTHQHVVSVFRKFGVRSRAELMNLWLRRP